MKVEILAPPKTSFVVGRDLVGYAKVGNDPDVWEDLIDDAGAFTAQRGGTQTSKLNALDVGTMSCPLKDADPETDDRLRVGRRLRLIDPDRGEVLWFGRLADVPSVDEREYMVTTLAATDVVDELANTTLGGVGTPGKLDQLGTRVAELASRSTVPLRFVATEKPVLPLPDVSTWTAKDLGGLASTITPVSGGGRVAQLAQVGQLENLESLGARFTIPVDWPAGSYKVSVTLEGSLTFWSDGGLVSSTVVGKLGAATATKASPLTLKAAVTVSGAPIVVEVRIPKPNQQGMFDVSLTVRDLAVRSLDGEVLQAVGQEAPLSKHLDMSCDSVGSVWRPTLAGEAEVIEGAVIFSADPVAHLTDEYPLGDADASFTKVQMGFAAVEDLINDLTVTNYGPSAETTRTYANASSIASHGRRSSTLETCLATPELMDARAERALTEAAVPRWSPRSVTYVYHHLSKTPGLYDLVLITRRGKTHLCLVLGVLHEVEPDQNAPEGRKHLVTLTLRKVATS